MDTPVTPLVSVVMPVYNAAAYLRPAIESILRQTYANLEFIIVNDGSTDASHDIISSYTDPRIIAIDQPNGGLVAAMTAGIERAQGVYIVRADADDISLPSRIEDQVRFMEQHPDIGVVSSWMRTIGSPNGYLMKSFTEPEDIRANLLFNTSIAQPSACMRASLFKEGGLAYDPAFKDGAEDYDLWARASAITKLACLPRVLVRYRMHDGNISSTRAVANQKNTRLIRTRQLAMLGLTPTDEELELHSRIKCSDKNSKQFLAHQKNWLAKIAAANDKRRVYESESLQRILRHRWSLLREANTRFGLFMRATRYFSQYLRRYS